MLEFLWLLPLLPFVGFFFQLVANISHLPRPVISSVAVLAVLLTFLLALLISADYLFLYTAGDITAFSKQLWTWFEVGDLKAGVTLRFDGLSLLMTLLVSGLALLTHIYACAHMKDDVHLARFFACMNLFVAGMLLLVLADNLIFLLLGWEAVSVCSYLLIGFWFRDPQNGYSARKAFLITRIGDAALILALCLIFFSFDTLDIPSMLVAAEALWPQHSGIANTAALLLLVAALAKSAQFPLHTWLGDAMAGPMPASALLHGATMMAAGVYLLARTHVLFLLAPDIQQWMAILGLVTVLLGGLAALTHHDIKKVLAFSTMSQYGYMFLALGIGAWSSAVFHLMSHAFFKTLLILASASLIISLHQEQNLLRMGGLRKSMPFLFWMFVIGCAALTALPFTSGFLSKTEILQLTYEHEDSSLLWVGALVGSFITAMYSSRLLFLIFFGPVRAAFGQERLPLLMQLPLFILAIFAILGAYLDLHVESVFLYGTHDPEPLATAQALTILVPLLGILLSWVLFVEERERLDIWRDLRPLRLSQRAFSRHLGIDWLMEQGIARPYQWLTRAMRHDLVERCSHLLFWSLRSLSRALAEPHTGDVRWYLLSMVAGVLLLLLMGGIL